jgi:hypothetical protein
MDTKRLLVTDDEGNVCGSLLLTMHESDERVTLKLSPGQLRALHAKCNAQDRILDSERGAARAAALADARAEFGREVEHFSDLTAIEASWLLDHLENAIVGARAER